MEKLSICHVCGRTIDNAFPFCPWCRSQMRREEPVSDFRVDFARPDSESGVRDSVDSRIERMAFSLGEIERELAVFLEGIPAERPS